MNELLSKVFLTFDVEDFINDRSILPLNHILRLLEKYNFRAIFFITGHMNEKLRRYPEVLEKLENHEIGFHSSGHSVRPTIFEYTDIENYEKAYQISLKRETSHINPLNGTIENNGGIYSLIDTFRSKKIRSFRAPGLCWSPPNLEALASLGIKFDFSTGIYFDPFSFRGIAYYPTTIAIDALGIREIKRILNSIYKRKTTVLFMHPHEIVNNGLWDSIYFDGNPKNLSVVPSVTWEERISKFSRLDLFFLWLKNLDNAKLIKITADLIEPTLEYRDIAKKWDLKKFYDSNIFWPKQFFNYVPKFLYRHFLRFFDEHNDFS